MPSGIVQSIEGQYAIVEIKRQDMCGDCHACDAVHEAKECTLKCINNVRSQVGDIVEISLDQQIFLKATFIMYGLPLAGLLGGLGIGFLATQLFVQLPSELLIIAGAFAGMLIAFLFIKEKEKRNQYKKMLPHIISIKNSTS
ncbi:MAG: SoxR reducing system RseC family protein [Clostridia bacterium]|jgi:sigma-E factor negative regulatory protein RseC|nr:SoxR reducing system RseC family protein [Clostridia bacterium]